MMSAEELFLAHLKEVTRDFAAWRQLFADNAVMEYPYGAHAGVASPLVGVPAIAQSVKGFLDSVENFQVTIGNIRKIEGEDAVFAEFSGSATAINTGRAYHQNYVVYLRAENGKIAEFREYFDASRVVAAFKP